MFLEIFYETILSLIYIYLAYHVSNINFKLIYSVERLFLFLLLFGKVSLIDISYEGSSY